jgi:hypothetical protein
MLKGKRNGPVTFDSGPPTVLSSLFLTGAAHVEVPSCLLIKGHFLINDRRIAP